MLIGDLIRDFFRCKTCEELRAQIAHERWQTQELLKHITYKPPIIEKELVQPQAISRPRMVKPPWDVSREIIEEESKRRIEKMEKDLGITFSDKGTTTTGTEDASSNS